jgi:hypothetical protein
MSRGRPLALGLALLAAGLLACGGGGGGGGPTTPPTPTPMPGITFTPATGASTDVLMLRRVGTGATTLDLEIQAEGVTGLYAASFDLVFPSALLRFDSADEGPFLTQDGADLTLQVVEAAPGRLVVGVSRLAAVPGVSGSGQVLVLHFASAGTGSSMLRFEANRAFRADGTPIDSVDWRAGTVQIN